MTEVRLPFQGKVIDAEVVFNTEDIESVDVSGHRGYDSGDDGEGHYTRTLNGRNTLTLRIEFKPFKYEMYEERKEPVGEQNIPHAARVVNQFALEERDGKKVFKGTGKLMCWCNCGEKTEWLGAYEEMGKVAAFLGKHEVAEEIGIKLNYSLGEMAGYRVEHSGLADPSLTLFHSCGWEKDLSAYAGENLLTDIVLEVVRNKHTCKPEETR